MLALYIKGEIPLILRISDFEYIFLPIFQKNPLEVACKREILQDSEDFA